MNIQVNTGNHIESGADLERHIKSRLSEEFQRYETTITRIEVHLTDQNSHKSGPRDKRCLLEARVANRDPQVVSHEAETIHQAFEEAVDKLRRSLDSMVGRLHSNENQVRTDA